MSNSLVAIGNVIINVNATTVSFLCTPCITMKPLSSLIDSHYFIHHSSTDDLQLLMPAPPDEISELLHSMQPCMSDVNAWATANMSKLNGNKK